MECSFDEVHIQSPCIILHTDISVATMAGFCENGFFPMILVDIQIGATMLTLVMIALIKYI